MGGGLIQLMAVGPQDKKLCGNPDTSFFKHVYSQYCNFGIEWFYQYFEGEKKLGKTVKCKLDKKGDLLRQMYVVFEVTSDSIEVPKLGLRLIDYVEIQIGGQMIDRHYAEWLDIWTQLNYNSSKYEMFKTLIMDKYHTGVRANNVLTDKCGGVDYKILYVPLIFWFNLNPGLALPLIALQYHDVTLHLKIKSIDDLKVYTSKNEILKYPLTANKDNKLYHNDGTAPVSTDLDISGGTVEPQTQTVYNFMDKSADISDKEIKWHKSDFTGELVNVYLLCEYIFLDTRQKRMFTSNSLEYLITQVQYTNKLDINKLTTNANTAANTLTLNFNHPIKELFFSVFPSWLDNMLIYKNMDNTYTITSIALFANNSKISEINNVEFYSLINPFTYYPCGGFSSIERKTNFNGGFYYYSFSLNPAKHQPTGTLNFSRLNDFVIKYIYKKSSSDFTEIDELFRIFAFGKNYNILKIENGMGGVLYSS